MKPDLSEIIRGLEKAFQDGVVVHTDRGAITLAHVYLGDLIVTSGHIVACDPEWADENTAKAFLMPVPPGRYPIILSIEHMTRRYQSGYRDYQSVAFAMLRLHEQLPVRWEVATVEEDDASVSDDGEIPGYSTDSGIGCFMDAEAASVFMQHLQSDPGYQTALDREMQKNYVDTWSWAMLSWESETYANLIAFSAGAGDNVYASYFGFDAYGTVVCLITDFALLWN